MTRPQATPRAIAVARGEEPADLLITGGRVFSPARREWVDTALALADGVVAGWGERDAPDVVDVSGCALTPAFIDAHMHLESTKLWIDEFVRTVLPHGTTAVAADPHEVANVLGVPGVVALAQAAEPLPFTFGVYASSCVPASPFESSGAALSADDIRDLIEEHGARGVAEVMNFPGVIAGDPEMLARIRAAGGRRVDGHSPGVAGRELDAYLAAGVESDHESTTLEEVIERRRKGMWTFIRQGSASQNLEALIPDVLEHGPELAALCTDDREPDTLCSARATSTTAPGSRWPPASPRSTPCCSPAPTPPATTTSTRSAALVRASRPTCSASTSSARGGRRASGNGAGWSYRTAS